MFKKFCFIILCFFVVSCASSGVKDEGGADSYNTDISEIGISTAKSFRVGMLLPLTGADSKYGQGLKNASMLALNNINNPSMVLQYYDTQSTSAGARVAIENAVNQRSNLIIGPLKSAEVQAISNETIYQGIPVIAFSTAQEVLQPTIYTLGLLIDEQVDRIMTYAVQQGRSRFALLLPDNATGGSVARAAVKSAQKNNVTISVIGFYKPGTSDFSDIAKQMTRFETRHAKAAQIKNKLQVSAASGDVQAQKALKKLETIQGLGDVGFDALLIPEKGAELTAAIAMFAYYDAAYPQVQFLGTSIWEASRLNNEATMVKSLYPSVEKTQNNAFANQYYAVFGEKPSSLYTLAYDAVFIANNLSQQTDYPLNDNITKESGFSTLNGKVRFFKNGTNQHSLDIVEIRPSGNVSVDSGSRFFETPTEPLPALTPDDTYQVPVIYGKDSSLAQIMIYGEVLSQESTSFRSTYQANDQDISTQQLNAMGIYIN